MAVETEVNDQVTTTPNENQDQNQPNIEEDNDPMIVAGREAEKELEAAKAEEGENPDKSADKGTAEAKAAVMVPKARLDTALNQRDQLRDQVAYYQGVVETQKQMVQGGATNQNPPTGQNGQPASTSKADETAPSISKLQDDKVSLAQKYEDGEISLVELRKQENAIDNQIREIDAKSIDERVEGAKQTAAQVVTAHNVATRIETEALKIQADHPYVAAIDKLPPAIKDGLWKHIDQEAQLSLAQRGINPNDGTLDSKVALMKIKAELTDKYGPQYTGVQINKPANQKTEQQKQREAKLELAAQQPPSLQNMGVGSPEGLELTPDQIMNMSDDALADLLAKNPHLVEKAVGNTR